MSRIVSKIGENSIATVDTLFKDHDVLEDQIYTNETNKQKFNRSKYCHLWL